jgi:hypothetical protein
VSDGYRIDVTQDQRGGLHYRFAVYRVDTGDLVKMSGPRYMTAAGARRRGAKWLAKQIRKGRLL